MKYGVTYREVFERTLLIEAKSKDEALALAWDKGTSQAEGEAFLVDQDILEGSVEAFTEEEVAALMQRESPLVIDVDKEDSENE